MITSAGWGRAPLSESALLAAAQRDDERAQTELLLRYEPLVRATVRRLQLPPRVEREDVEQEARIALLAAVLAWRRGRGAFAAFAARCLRNRALMVVRDAGFQKRGGDLYAASLDSRVPERDPDPEEAGLGRAVIQGVLRAPGPGPQDVVLLREQLAALRAGLSTLTPRERAALTGVLAGRSRLEVATELGGTTRAVNAAVRRARLKLAGEALAA